MLCGAILEILRDTRTHWNSPIIKSIRSIEAGLDLSKTLTVNHHSKAFLWVKFLVLDIYSNILPIRLPGFFFAYRLLNFA